MTGVVVVLMLIALVYAASCRYGVDSRDGLDWRRRDPSRGRDATLRGAHAARADLSAAGGLIRRAAGTFADFNRTQVDAWDGYLRRESCLRARWLRWVAYRDGWRLVGRYAPPTRRPPGGSTAGSGARTRDATRR